MEYKQIDRQMIDSETDRHAGRHTNIHTGGLTAYKLTLRDSGTSGGPGVARTPRPSVVSRTRRSAGRVAPSP